MVWYWIVYPLGAGSTPVSLGEIAQLVEHMLCKHGAVGSIPIFSIFAGLWDEAEVACQFHALNVEGSIPSPTI